MTVRSALLLLAMLLVSAARLCGQGFHIHIVPDRALKGTATLVIFQDTVIKRQTTRVRHGAIDFSGDVQSPAYAEVSHPSLHTPLPLIIDNSDINIRLSVDSPATSAINGSRPNSMMRYRVEQWAGSVDSAAAYVSLNLSHAENASLLLSAAADPVNANMLSSLCDSMKHPATATQCYSLLRQTIDRHLILANGKPMVNFNYIDAKGSSVNLYSELDSNHYNTVIIAASWCRPCSTAIAQINNIKPVVQTITINIDQQSGGWDAPFMHTLAVEHIPTIILLAPDGTIVARDIRWWEIERTINSYNNR